MIPPTENTDKIQMPDCRFIRGAISPLPIVDKLILKSGPKVLHSTHIFVLARVIDRPIPIPSPPLPLLFLWILHP